MSRIGKNPITITDKVALTVEGQTVKIKGGNYEKVIVLKPCISAELKDKELVLTRANDEAESKAYHGLFRSLIQNAVTGISEGFKKTLELKGVGYRASVSGKVLEMNLGYSHPIKFNIPNNIEIKVNKQTLVNVMGPDKEQVGEVAAQIRGFRPPEPYLGKGVKYVDEHIRRKAGKSAAKAK